MALGLELNNWSSSEPASSPPGNTTPTVTSVPTATNVIPSQTNPNNPSNTLSQPTSIPSSSPNAQSLTNSYTTFTTSYPVVISQLSTTYTSYVTSVVTTSTAMSVTQTPSPQANIGVNSVCIGHGIDSVSIGLLAVAILSALIGFIIWVRAAGVCSRARLWLTSSLLTLADIRYCST